MVADGGTPIQSRIGVNTGEVVVRSIHTGAGHVEYTPIGHTANLASRMQSAAPVGSIAVTEATRKLCEGYFILKSLGATKVKGVAEPVNVYEVTGLGPIRTRLQRSAGRGLVKFVGRQREMDAMKHAAEQAKAGHGQIVAAMAEAGVGKSRLLFEFKAVSRSGWMVLETFSVSHGKASAFLPLIDLLHSYFEIASEDDSRRRRQRSSESCWNSIARWKIPLRTSTRCWGSSKARTRSCRWMRKSNSAVPSKPSNGCCCANRSINR